jgi:hypothetical protein
MVGQEASRSDGNFTSCEEARGTAAPQRTIHIIRPRTTTSSVERAETDLAPGTREARTIARPGVRLELLRLLPAHRHDINDPVWWRPNASNHWLPLWLASGAEVLQRASMSAGCPLLRRYASISPAGAAGRVSGAGQSGVCTNSLRASSPTEALSARVRGARRVGRSCTMMSGLAP